MCAPDGSIVPFDKEDFEETRKHYASLTYRTLGIAYVDYTAEEWMEL